MPVVQEGAGTVVEVERGYPGRDFAQELSRRGGIVRPETRP